MKTDTDTNDLRKAALTLTTSAGAELVNVDPISKPLLAALFEQALPEGDEFRGLTYPRELDDLGEWLASCACCREVVGNDRILAVAGAWLCEQLGEGGTSGLQMARAIGAYFIHRFAWTERDAQDDLKRSVGQ